MTTPIIAPAVEPRPPIRAMAEVLRGRQAPLATMAASGAVSGLAEALFLVGVTRAAFAITDGDERVGIVASYYLSVNATLLVALGLVVVRMASASLSAWQGSRLASRSVADVRSQLSSAFLHATWHVQQNQAAGSLQQFLVGYSGYANGLVGGVGQFILTAVNLGAMLALAIAVDPLGAIVLVASVGVLSILLRPLRRAVRRRSRAVSDAGMEFATEVSEISQLGLELHVFRVQDAAEQRVAGLIEKTRRTELRLGYAAGMTAPAYTGLAYIALLGALFVASASSTRTLADLGAVMLIMLRSLSYGQALQNSYMRIVQSIPPLEDLYSRLRLFESTRRRDGEQPIGSVGALAAQGVTFSYAPGAPALLDVTFSIAPKEIIGIVGPSGGGKSTLVQLLLGVREPDSGMILADGRDIRDLDREEWARKVTFVPQEAHLITGSIAENISFLRRDVAEEDVVRAARMASLHEDVIAMSGGYDRRLGPDGARLSGGQQQRLCIARALVEDPDVLILDEPTSALDVRSESLIRRTLLELRERMAVIIIAHRLSTLDICDRIMVIQDGLLVDFDTPANLEKSSDFYREALILSGMRGTAEEPE